VIEIADSSLRYDRDVKAPLYAREGIVEYWLVDLNDQSVTGYTEVSDGVYGRSVTWRRGQSLAPAQLPGVILRVDDLLT
jgi:Uma2 family endonuclease